jgi:hypothetical protein
MKMVCKIGSLVLLSLALYGLGVAITSVPYVPAAFNLTELGLGVYKVSPRILFPASLLLTLASLFMCVSHVASRGQEAIQCLPLRNKRLFKGMSR